MNRSHKTPTFSPFLIALLLIFGLSSATCSGLNGIPEPHPQQEQSPRLVDLFIPGTHDSGAINGIAKCQDISLEEQLAVGIRAFDIRLVDRYDGSGKMDVYHGIVKYPLEWTEDILPLFARFLVDHPDEFIIISLRKEDDKNGSAEHHQAYQTSLLNSIDDERVSSFVYRGPITLRTTKKDLAGKIVIFSRNKFADAVPIAQYDSFGHDKTARTSLVWPGLDRQPFPLLIEDDYKVQDIIHKSDKKTAIKEALELAAEVPGDELNIFFLSGSAPALPLSVARAINPFALELLKGMSTPPAGIYFVDFAGRSETRELINYLQELNEQNDK